MQAVPQGDEQWMRQQAHKMFSDLGQDFFGIHSMMENQGQWIWTTEKKCGGGFAPHLRTRCAIHFANFNGTNGDVQIHP